MSRVSRQKNIAGYIFIGPWLIGFICFAIYPLVYSLGLSFTDWNILESPNFVGLANYKHMFLNEDFWAALKVTFIYSFVSVPFGLLIGILLAILLNQKMRGIRIFRTIFYLPAVASGVAVSMLWLWVLDPDFGLINMFLSYIGIEGPNWLSSSKTALVSLIIMSFWGVGGSMVIFLAGLQGISITLYEAAEVDGAGPLRKFISITIPMLTPTIFFNLILGVINSFQVFTQALVMTGGGPGNSTLFYVLYLYRNAFEFFKMGYASALGWVLFIIILLFVLILFKTSGNWVHYEFDHGASSKSSKKKRKLWNKQDQHGKEDGHAAKKVRI
ncbi:carbohydrate ABC transporter permease [Paenibacillus senegalensis]|uniref:carbohydrate ABC transporter permease n=1 Tax=Paenibacillus senegalensis TaxID=1465766 RepID=UPI00028909A0|nr:sugar ABC transporter permease [Paenibacillus senegalensis]